MDRGEALFAESHPFGAFVRRHRLPCCTMTALWIALVEGVPVDLSASITRAAMSVRSSGNGWEESWDALNVVDGRAPWSPLDATFGRVQYARLVSTSTPAPSLTPGRWHLIQRWRGLEGGRVVAGSRGHAYLVRADDDGQGCTVHQSSEAKGYRSSAGSWDGTAGLDGWWVGRVTLPRLPESDGSSVGGGL
jgi:hypothetical protein